MNGKLPLIVELQEMVALIVATKKFFFVLHKRRRGEKGAAVACGGEKPSCEWFFSTPGWRRHCPSGAGNPTRSAKYKRDAKRCLFCILEKERVGFEGCGRSMRHILQKYFKSSKYFTIISVVFYCAGE